jgi:uncharacterized protein
VDRVFLDANVLFSAAYREDSGLRRLWDLADAILVTSGYALEEARRNLDLPAQRERLADLAGRMAVVADAPGRAALPRGIELPEDDRPILAAAISAKATHLLSGDRRAFGPYYGKRVAGIRVLRPAEYLARARR